MSKVAILEDDMAIAGMYQFKLHQSGYDVAVAHNGVDGLKKIIDFRPELILLDLMMPGMTGGEVLAKVRATAWGKDIRVIILTNISRDEAPVELRELGVDHYIVKAQYTPRQVLQLVEEVLALPPRKS